MQHNIARDGVRYHPDVTLAEAANGPTTPDADVILTTAASSASPTSSATPAA